MATRHAGRAVPVACLGIATFTLMDVLMKQLSITSGAYAAVLWRSAAGSVLVGALFLAKRRPWPGPAALRLHVARGLAAGSSVLFFFWGLARIPMAKGVALTFLAPLIALFLAAAFLGERVRRAAIWGSLAASVGVGVIAAGEVSARSSTAEVAGAVAVVIASFLYGGSLILLRRQAQAADPLEVTLFTSLTMLVVLLPGGPWLAGLPTIGQLPWIVGAAILGSASAAMLAWAYARAETQALAPVEYTAFVWAALFGWLAFGEGVSAYTVTGALLIAGGCLVAVRRAVAAPVVQVEAGA